MTARYQSMNLNGMPVIISEPVLCSRDVKRTWKERFFTLPFKPFTRFKKESYWQNIIEDGQIIRHGNNLVMNAKTWRECRMKLAL